MSETPEGARIHESFNAHGDLLSEVTLNLIVMINNFAKFDDFIFT